MLAFTPQPQSLTTLWQVLISRPAEGRRLSWHGARLHTQVVYPPKTVIHPSTNRARRRVTSLIRPRTLPLRQTATGGNVILKHDIVICLFQAFILRLYILGAVFSQTQRNARNARKNQNMLLSACAGRFSVLALRSILRKRLACVWLETAP